MAKKKERPGKLASKDDAEKLGEGQAQVQSAGSAGVDAKGAEQAGAGRGVRGDRRVSGGRRSSLAPFADEEQAWLSTCPQHG